MIITYINASAQGWFSTVFLKSTYSLGAFSLKRNLQFTLPITASINITFNYSLYYPDVNNFISWIFGYLKYLKITSFLISAKIYNFVKTINSGRIIINLLFQIKEGFSLVKFSIVDLCGNKKDIALLIRELRQNNLIAGTEKDIGGDTVYLTHNLVAIKKMMDDYDGLTLDVHKE